MTNILGKVSLLTERQNFLFAAAGFVGVGLFMHWFLFLAFLCVLPPLNEDIERLREDLLHASVESVKPVAAAAPKAARSRASGDGDTRIVAPSPASVTDESTPVASSSRKMAPWGSPTLRIRDQEGNILEVNSDKPVPYESDYFKGHILTMVRCDGGRWEHHFAGKQRKFEVQIQGKMKQLPTGNVMLGGELQEKVEFGLVTRTLISILMRFTAKLLPSMRYSLGEAYSADGNYECPHISSPLFRTMDRVWVTPEGEEPPPLGKELPEPDAERNLRRGGKAPYTNMKFEMGKTYSFSFHSMYLDFGNWVITNVPGYSGLSLKTIVENQSVSVVCYDVPVDPPGKTLRHCANNKKYLTYMEYAHITTIPESDMKEYNEYMANPIPEDEEVVAELAPIGAAAAASEQADDEPGTPPCRSAASTPGGEVAAREDDSSGNDLDDDALADVPSNSFLPITLLHDDSIHSLPASLTDSRKPLNMPYENPVWPGVGGKNGFAVVRDFQDVQSLKFIKLTATTVAAPKPRASMRMWPSKSKKNSKSSPGSDNGDLKDAGDADDKFWKSDHKPGEKLRNGDVILVQSAITGEYLTIQRGWWLVWTSRAPQNRKGRFIVTFMDHEDKPRVDSSPLYVGFPFRLRSARWPTWQVGLQMTPSSTYGGKLLTLYHPPKASGERHISMDMSAAFSKNTTIDGFAMPKYSSKSVRPLVLSVLPESVCEKHSRETVGMIRAVMSLNTVYRDPNLSNRPTPLASMKSNEAPVPPLAEASPYMHSSRISMPLTTRDSIGFRDYWNLPLEEPADPSKSSRSMKKYDGLSYRYFPKSLITTPDLSTVNFELTGWVEVVNRDNSSVQLAYMLACEIPDNDNSDDYDVMEISADVDENPRVIFTPSTLNITPSGGYSRSRRFTVLRTGSQIFETISAINEIQGSPATKQNLDRLSTIQRPNPLERNFSKNSTDISSVLGEPDLDRILSEPATPFSAETKSDSSDEPNWAANKNFSRALADGTHDTGDFEFSSNYVGNPIGVICPRHQSDADHSFQLLSSLLMLAQKKESLHVEKVMELAEDSKVSHGKQFDFPARRFLLELAASNDDDLTAYFVSDVARASQSSVASESKPSHEKKRSLSIHRTVSVSSSDLVGQSNVSPLLRTTVVARALSDYHWREEFVELHSSFISFLPLTSGERTVAKPSATYPGARRKNSSKSKGPAVIIAAPTCLTLLLVDITSVSMISEAYSKFPGYHVLKLESLGRVTYLAFNSLSQCESFAGYVLELKSEASFVENESGDLTSVEGVMGDPRDSFVLRSSRWRPHSRMLLNSRRFHFDIDQQRTEALLSNVTSTKPWNISYPGSDLPASSPSAIPYWELSARLLRDVAFLCESSLGESTRDEDKTDGERLKMMGTDRLTAFLDDVGALKLIDLISIDYSSKEAVCFFVNIYHTLLLHARLVLGSPNDETWTSFFDTVSYEIGGDVFSLIELEHCVLRGKISRPEVLPKVGYKLPQLDDDRYAYALSAVDQRINFVINDCSMVGSNAVYLLEPDSFEKQLEDASRATLEFCLDINTAKRSITLPRACYLYRQDFVSVTEEGSKSEDITVLNACLRYFGSAQSENIRNLLDSAKQERKGVHVRFRDADFNSHSNVTVQ